MNQQTKDIKNLLRDRKFWLGEAFFVMQRGADVGRTLDGLMISSSNPGIVTGIQGERGDYIYDVMVEIGKIQERIKLIDSQITEVLGSTTEPIEIDNNEFSHIPRARAINATQDFWAGVGNYYGDEVSEN